LIRLQSGDGVRNVATAEQIVFCATGQRKRNRERLRGFRGRLYPFCGEFSGVDGILRIRARVLDRSACQTDGRGQPDGFGDGLGIVSVPVLQIGAHGQVRGG
jgi:hypothetical protein